ncbi:hypothetical protein L3X38_011682 [Prunus dulcis]|uniref:Reverse transcriptase Ty1/copia-type domain-containing protein n=1 Tax=Prunus dulcis TaxID=3755 RepID=A0AAD4ZFN1_PRUDU|nr:hypothetical protein L3X38_011682 [Prunus dulcis]
MMRRYEMTDLGLLYHFLGMAVIQTENCIFINQKKYALTLLKKFGLKQCKPVSTPLVASEKLCKDDGSEPADENKYRQMVGSLLYLIATRTDIMFAASLLARFMHCPTKKHYGTAKRVLRYIQGTIDFGIKYQKGKEAILIGYCDSDWSGSQDDMRSTSGYAFSFGSRVFSWASVKQHSVALSTAEAEYVSASEATTQNTCYSIETPTIPSLLSPDRARLLYAIGNNVPIDLATYIFRAICGAAFPTSMPDSLPFVSLITRCTMASRMPVEPTNKLYSPWSPSDNMWIFVYSFTPSSSAVKHPQTVVSHTPVWPYLPMTLLSTGVIPPSLKQLSTG